MRREVQVRCLLSFLEIAGLRVDRGSIGLRDAFGVDGESLEKAVLSMEDEGEVVGAMEAFLRQRLPERDENVETINRITA